MKKITLLIFVMFAFSFYSCEQDFVVEDADAIATKHKKKKENSDCECDKEVGITQLTLEYKGDAPVGTDIVVKTEKPKHYGHDHNKKKDKKFEKAFLVWEGKVGDDIIILPGELDDKLERLGNKTWIQIGTDKPFEIHTSCSQPITPGTVFGDFVVISGASGDHIFDCQPEIPSGDCGDCDGQITYLEIEYLGSGPATIDVYGHKKHDKAPFFTKSEVSQGDSFSFSGKENHNKMGPKIFLDDGSGRVEIHTSCSQPIEVGMIFGGKYLIKAGASHDGGPLCEEEDCISRLQEIIPTAMISAKLTDYVGDPQSYFEIDLTGAGALTGFYLAHCIEKDPPAIRNTYYDAYIYSTYESLPSIVTDRSSLGDGMLQNLDQLNYIINKYKVGDSVSLYDDNCIKISDDKEELTFSDLQLVMWYFTDGSFDILENNPRILEYSYDRIWSVICDAQSNGEGFEPECGDKIGAMIVPVTDGQIAMIVLDCIDDCDPPEEENCGPCEGGGISSLTLEYKGTADKITVTVKGKKGKKGSDSEAFSEEFDVSSNKIFTVKSNDLSEKIGGSNELILTDSEGGVQNIHISCSQPIDIGLEFGDYEIVDGYGVKSGPFCND